VYEQNSRRATIVSERQCVAQPTSKEQLCDRQYRFVFAETGGAAGAMIGGEVQRAVAVHYPLRLSCRARAVEPEGNVVSLRVGRQRLGIVAVRKAAERRGGITTMAQRGLSAAIAFHTAANSSLTIAATAALSSIK
jgi:hypothetical protein